MAPPESEDSCAVDGRIGASLPGNSRGPVSPGTVGAQREGCGDVTGQGFQLRMLPLLGKNSDFPHAAARAFAHTHRMVAEMTSVGN